MECKNHQHEYVVEEECTGFTCYVCRKCGNKEYRSTLWPVFDDSQIDDGVTDDLSKNKSPNSDYVDLNPGKTTELFSDTLELFLCHTGETVRIQKRQIEVGRGKECDLRLENPYVARKQATFFYEEPSWYLRDNNTTNGTYINGVKLQAMKKYLLSENDRIGFAGKSVEAEFRRLSRTTEPIENTEEKSIAILEAAMKVFSKSDFRDETSLNLIVGCLQRVPLYFPVELDIAAMLGGLDPTKLRAGDRIQPTSDVKMRILTLMIDDGYEIVPMFTSSQKAQKNQQVSTIRQYPQDYMEKLLHMNKPVVINPFDDARFIISPNFLKEVLAPLILKAPHANAVPHSGMEQVAQEAPKEGFENKVINHRYRILKRISKDNLAKVYLAMNEHINQVCAVKVCGKSGKAAALHEHVLNEAMAMMKLDHPAIPRIYDIVEDENNTYIVREYIQGESLDVILKEYGAQPVDRVIDWTKKLCDVLKYLHGLNPPHIYRDMKPANVLLEPDGKVRLIDFGIMRTYDAGKTRDTTMLGTKGYAAPEQYGGSAQSDARTDIFALGMTMHYLVTGVNPVSSRQITQPIRKINPELPARLEAIIQKCIEPDMAKRYQNIESLLIDLNGATNSAKKKSLLSKIFGK